MQEGGESGNEEQVNTSAYYMGICNDKLQFKWSF